MAKVLVYLWTLPTTLVGLLFVPLALISNGRVTVSAGVLEIQGGLVARFLRACVLVPGGASAMTFGHVVIGRDAHCLDRSRAHERVHVRQCERWGPFFLPAYLLASASAALRGLDPYRDNRFEREAYEKA